MLPSSPQQPSQEGEYRERESEPGQQEKGNLLEGKEGVTGS